VHLIVEDDTHAKRAQSVIRRVGIPEDRVRYFKWPTDRGWARDFGPLFTRAASGVRIAGFAFNAWAKYENYHLDAKVARAASESLGVPFDPITHKGAPVVMEGGALDVNGSGSILTTEECLLDLQTQVRNPGFDRADYESVFESALGAANTIWLGRGISGDDTHGHVDDLCRFVGPRTVVLCQEDNPQDDNYEALSENRERLEQSRAEDGSKLEVVGLPMPAPLYFDGHRLPASYANFYITNGAVLVPTFNDPLDRVALGILAEVFPSRKVIGIHAVDLVWGFGTLHCLTQQQPQAAPVSGPAGETSSLDQGSS